MLNTRSGNDPKGKPADSPKPAVQMVTAPAPSLPKGGGAIRGIGEKFSANLVTGTGTMTVPIATSPGRSGFHPELALTYDSGAGNGPFGLGWHLSVPSISRKTDKGLPQSGAALKNWSALSRTGLARIGRVSPSGSRESSLQVGRPWLRDDCVVHKREGSIDSSIGQDRTHQLPLRKGLSRPIKEVLET